ncbi:helicase-related protein [Limimaricola pyoseonensis]|uniref:ATP-dependent RNA helicase SUPV3L1/SUV3 n=1 Tax=Limimaricola pyoseonensis TaxID=521013 RepID=A0A1G7D2V2_9RHOB|nr:helicase-related protein [Limimaricola pyoseonensis]SDE45859.1 ATP-dependent RNA helicase SUPV3L1/SUV3 [Limimaricola pyoseonensis]
MTPSRIGAVLGPTNTGKTHYAIERMLAYRTGVIGLPLRLLAREVYDRIVKARGPGVVALVTGEERIVPPRAAYWVCTVEAMPEMDADFLAVDEIQLCADPERGHVFTDRLLHARGRHETLFLGSETMAPAIRALVPEAEMMRRERLSVLSYAGSKKLSRMPERSAVVGFSVDSVYAIAELIRRQKGGAAVVMGALSPRTRNAQVEMYQNGDVDYLVATDAIGMGLNLDIGHVAFSSLIKFDGHKMRHLAPPELAQIAGRAGRHKMNGSFGVTGEAPPLEEETVEAIENHRFRPVTRLFWRNSRLQFGSLRRLIQTLEERTSNPWLGRVRESDDLAALKTLAADPVIAARAHDGPSVKLLWEVCRLPDFRGIGRGEHAEMVGQIFSHLQDRGRIPEDWFAKRVQRIDRTDGDIDALSKRLAYVRTWTYVAQRSNWLSDESHWREVTRAVEDRLSDALHGALTQRFVDRRTSVLARRLKQKEVMVAEVTDTGDVTVEGEFVGRLEGFRFRADKAGGPDEAKTLRQAAEKALAPQFHLRADRFYNAPDTEIDVTEQGGLMWGSSAVGKLVSGPDAFRPQVVAYVDEEAGAEISEKVKRRLQHFIDRKIAATQEPLLALKNDEALTGVAKGFAYRMVENFGVIPRGEVAEEVRGLDQEARGALRKHGIRFGQFTVFMPALLKPAPTRIRLVLWALSKNLQEFPETPPPGLVTVPATRGAAPGYYAMAGYRAAGERAIRIDMLERLADMLRDRDSKNGFEAVPDMLSITGLTLDQFAELMSGLGYKAEKGERPKARPVKAGDPQEVPGDVPDTTPPAPEGPDVPGETPQEAPDQPDAPGITPPEPPTAPDLPDETPPAPDQPDAPPASPTDVPGTQPDVPPAEVPGDSPDRGPAPAPDEMPDSDPPAGIPAGSPTEIPPGTIAVGETAPEAAHEAADQATEQAAETETFYTFTWAGRGQRRGREGGEGKGRRQAKGDGAPRGAKGGKPQGKGKSDGKRRGDKPERGDKPRQFSSQPQREKKIDPDNPFAAALAGFKRD